MSDWLQAFIDCCARTCSASWYCTEAVMASSSLSILSLHVRFRPSHAAFIWEKVGKYVSQYKVQLFKNICIYLAAIFEHNLSIFYLINGLFDFGLLSFSTGEDQVGTKSPYKLQLFPQTIRLCLDGLIWQENWWGDRTITCECISLFAHSLPRQPRSAVWWVRGPRQGPPALSQCPGSLGACSAAPPRRPKTCRPGLRRRWVSPPGPRLAAGSRPTGSVGAGGGSEQLEDKRSTSINTVVGGGGKWWTGNYLLVSYFFFNWCPLIFKTLVHVNDKASFVYFLLEIALSSFYSHYPCTLKSFISAERHDGALHRRL